MDGYWIFISLRSFARPFIFMEIYKVQTRFGKILSIKHRRPFSCKGRYFRRSNVDLFTSVFVTIKRRLVTSVFVTIKRRRPFSCERRCFQQFRKTLRNWFFRPHLCRQQESSCQRSGKETFTFRFAEIVFYFRSENNSTRFIDKYL